MAVEEGDPAAIDAGGWRLRNKEDYIEALNDVLRFPLRKDDGLVKLFLIGSALNLFIAPAVSDALLFLVAIPGLILAGYMGHVGHRVSGGDEKPPDFEIDEWKRYFFTGARLLVLVGGILFTLSLLLIPAAIVIIMLGAIGLEGIVEAVILYGFTAIAFLCLIFFLPGWLIYGREHRIREMVNRKNLREEFIARTIRREYVEAFAIYLPFGIAVNIVHQITDFVPFLTFLTVPFVFYIQLAMMKAIGRGYGASIE